MRLNLEDNKIMKKLSFKIKSHGFDFNNFSNITGLNILGEVKQRNNSIIHFEPMKNSIQAGIFFKKINKIYLFY